MSENEMEKLLKGQNTINVKSSKSNFPETYTDTIKIGTLRYLNMHGISPETNGFPYLLTMIQLICDERLRTIKITELYEKVAGIYVVRTPCLERAVRYLLAPRGLTNKELITRAFFDITCVDNLSEQLELYRCEGSLGKMKEAER